MWTPQPWVDWSMKIVNSARKGRIGIPDVRNDRGSVHTEGAVFTLGIDKPCFRRQNKGTSCCLDVSVHESTHPADLF